ncbi:unnamed protein product [Hanseniaspora opuntiae]
MTENNDNMAHTNDVEASGSQSLWGRSQISKKSENTLVGSILGTQSRKTNIASNDNTNVSNSSTLVTKKTKMNVADKMQQLSVYDEVDEQNISEIEEENDISVVGKPLRVLNGLSSENDTSVVKDINTVSTKTINSKDNNTINPKSANKENVKKTVFVIQRLPILCENLSFVIDDIHQNMDSVSKATMSFIDILKNFIDDEANKNLKMHVITFENNVYMTKIFKMVLHLCDNFLFKPVYQTTRAILLTKFSQFCNLFNIKTTSKDDLLSNEDVRVTMPCLQLFPNLEKSSEIEKIMHGIIELSKNNSVVSESEGSFIAPLKRGFTQDCSITSIMFGVAEDTVDCNLSTICSLYSMFPNIHFYSVADQIEPCSVAKEVKSITDANIQTQLESLISNWNTLPFRTPKDFCNPPISLSVSTLNRKTKMSGTLGGFIQPVINENSPKQLKHYGNSVYGITCAHVILSESQDYPEISLPSLLLQQKYITSLNNAKRDYPEGSKQRDIFNKEISRIEQYMDFQFQNPAGQVIWGERCILNDAQLSDFAIVKMNKNIKLECGNYLGDDVIQSLGDPSLRFDNGFITDYTKMNDIKPGVEIFKYGSSTKFTRGFLNGQRMVYWSDGKLQSSEFVINSLNNNPLFATGGDSGSFVLRKNSNKLGLSVVGMLHSYDGEMKQLGLFTPMDNILTRLKAVTKVEWQIKSKE